jgi:hypothetical protein
MTIKQIIVGTVLGATALGTMVHRIPKPAPQAVKISAKAPVKNTKLAKAQKKHAAAERLSLTKVFG